MDLRVNGGGRGEPLLLLLHGLGATGDVWSRWAPLLAERWPGRWLAPDLPGHGGSAPLPEYTFEALAEAVRPLVGSERTVVLGHSLGGVVALALASGSEMTAVVGLGVKVSWTGDELAQARAMADRPVQWFDSREEAEARHLRVSGLAGLVAGDDPAVGSGVREEGGRWRLALDPRAFAVGAPDMAGLVARSAAPVTLARGEHDPMSTDDQIRGLGLEPVPLTGRGHNAHVESPADCYPLISSRQASH